MRVFNFQRLLYYILFFIYFNRFFIKKKFNYFEELNYIDVKLLNSTF